MQGYKEFDPDKEIPSLSGKVILVTGGKWNAPLMRTKG